MGASGAAVERIVALQAKAGRELIPLGVFPYPEGPRCVTGRPGAAYDWVVLPLRDDPLYRRRELGMPATVRSKLRRLDAAGVCFDDLLIAHEVPRGSLATRDVKVPDASAVDTAIEGAPTAPGAAATLLGKTVRGITTTLAVTASAPVVALTALASVLPDPVLFGVIGLGGTPMPGDPVAVFEIARW